MGLGILLFFVNVIVTRRRGDRAANDPWVADTLEWYTTAAAARELRCSGSVRDQSAPAFRTSAAGSASCAISRRGPNVTPGPWLWLTAGCGGCDGWPWSAARSEAASPTRACRRSPCRRSSCSCSQRGSSIGTRCGRRRAALVLFGVAALVTGHVAHTSSPPRVRGVASSRPRSSCASVVRRFVARLRGADETADHVAPPADGALRDDRRRRRGGRPPGSWP